jgi:hypothetical protein
MKKTYSNSEVSLLVPSKQTICTGESPAMHESLVGSEGSDAGHISITKLGTIESLSSNFCSQGNASELKVRNIEISFPYVNCLLH